jgi:mono/diheme cytochrome c family protein
VTTQETSLNRSRAASFETPSLSRQDDLQYEPLSHAKKERRFLMKVRASTTYSHILFARIAQVFAFMVLSGIICCFLQMSAHRVYAASREKQEAGAALFHEKGCERCHGVDGVGAAKAPDLRTIGKRWKKSQIEHQIIYGGFEMPPFKDALEPNEVKELVAYLSAKRRLPKNP